MVLVVSDLKGTQGMACGYGPQESTQSNSIQDTLQQTPGYSKATVVQVVQ